MAVPHEIRERGSGGFAHSLDAKAREQPGYLCSGGRTNECRVRSTLFNASVASAILASGTRDRPGTARHVVCLYPARPNLGPGGLANRTDSFPHLPLSL